jgi:curved DNA-binding protein CbpA
MTRRPTEPDFDPYRILRIDPEADDEIIQVVYRRLARRYHPDVAPGPEAAAMMVEINAAMDILGDPARRAEFDRRRAVRDVGATERFAAGSGGGAAPGGGGSSESGPSPRSGAGEPRPQTVSRDWTTGRSSVGGGYDPGRMRTPDGQGAAGPPPGNPSGTVLNFGRYAGWSLGEIARRDLEYLEWLDRMAIGRAYRDEVDTLLRAAGRRRSAPVDDARRGLFRRR